jgi:hypothetical protein
MDKQNVRRYAQDFCVQDLEGSLDDAIKLLTDLKKELTVEFGEHVFLLDIEQYGVSDGDVIDESQIQYEQLETDGEYIDRMAFNKQQEDRSRMQRKEQYLRLKEEFKDE